MGSFGGLHVRVDKIGPIWWTHIWLTLVHSVGYLFSPTAGSFGVSAQIGSGVVWGGPEVRFHEGSTRFCGVARALERAPHAVGDIT